MGFLGSLFGGGGKSTSTSTATSGPPAWLEDASKHVVNRALTLSNKPYKGWAATQRYAPTSATDLEAIERGKEAASSGLPFLAKASSVLGDYTPWTEADREAYMNPYMEDVLRTSQRDLAEQYDYDLRGLRARQPSLSALSSPGYADAESRANRDFYRQYGDLTSNITGRAYEDAYNKWLGDRTQRIQESAQLGRLGEATQALGQGGAEFLRNVGENERNLLDQRYRDWEYGEFEKQRMWPYQQNEFLRGAVSGVPYTTTQTATTTQKSQPNIGILPAIGDLLGGAIGLYNAGSGAPSGGGKSFFSSLGFG